MKLRKKIIVLFLLVLVQISAKAQEFQANVEIIYDRIPSVDEKVFQNMKQSLTELINNRKWTNDIFTPNEKIQANFLINVSERVGPADNNTYKGTISVQSSRPVYGTNYSTSLFNVLDRELVFKFEASQNVVFEETRVAGSDPLIANLPAVVVFYLYMILGMDYDSFSKKGGDAYFRKAQNIVMQAPEDKLITGWKSSENNKRNRYFFIDQILNPRFSDVREFYYDYHINGLDVMKDNPEQAMNNIKPLFSELQKVNLENPSSIYIQSIFNAKTQELQNILSQITQPEKGTLGKILAELDVPNAGKYLNAR